MSRIDGFIDAVNILNAIPQCLPLFLKNRYRKITDSNDSVRNQEIIPYDPREGKCYAQCGGLTMLLPSDERDEKESTN